MDKKIMKDLKNVYGEFLYEIKEITPEEEKMLSKKYGKFYQPLKNIHYELEEIKFMLNNFLIRLKIIEEKIVYPDVRDKLKTLKELQEKR
jgi:hypothetical protein